MHVPLMRHSLRVACCRPAAAPHRLLHFALPDALVADYPAEKRGGSRLLNILPPAAPAQSLRPGSQKILKTCRDMAQHAGTGNFKIKGGGKGKGAAAEGTLVDWSFADLQTLLPSGCHIVFNESKVLPARMRASVVATRNGVGSATAAAPLAGSAAVGDSFEVLFLQPAKEAGVGEGEAPADSDALLGVAAHGQVWEAMVRRADVAEGDLLQLHPQPPQPISHQQQGRQQRPPVPLSLRVQRVHGTWIEEDEDDGIEADLVLESSVATSSSSDATGTSTNLAPTDTLAEVFEQYGEVPIPPYMGREADDSDATRYQTVYANKAGSVAAPTAGLHFTPEVLGSLEEEHGHALSRVTLHVGAGTFKPVQGDDIAAHDMHTEIFEVERAAIEALHASLVAGKPIVPVGTTTVRVLESLYWIGVRTLLQGQQQQQQQQQQQHLSLGQWEPMALEHEVKASGLGSKGAVPPADALAALLATQGGSGASTGSPTTYRGSTSICIAPGYTFALADALVTNFHQPGSTLLYLTAALLGGTEPLFDAYRHAVEQEYMFLSYGDACLIVNHQLAEA